MNNKKSIYITAKVKNFDLTSTVVMCVLHFISNCCYYLQPRPERSEHFYQFAREHLATAHESCCPIPLNSFVSHRTVPDNFSSRQVHPKMLRNYSTSAPDAHYVRYPLLLVIRQSTQLQQPSMNAFWLHRAAFDPCKMCPDLLVFLLSSEASANSHPVLSFFVQTSCSMLYQNSKLVEERRMFVFTFSPTTDDNLDF